MKKISAALIILLLFCFAEGRAQGFKAGIDFGFANTDVNGTDPYDVDFNKIGFNIGMFVARPLTEKSNLRFEMNFIEKGSYIPPVFDSLGNQLSNSYKIRLNYIEVPVIYAHRFGFKMDSSFISRFDIELGLYIGFLIHSDEDLNNSGPQPVTTGPQYPDYSKYDFGGLIGFAYHISENWKFNFRYENSIIPIRPHPGGGAGFNTNYIPYYNAGETNLVFVYSLSYTF
jgi:hypothetical protein